MKSALATSLLVGSLLATSQPASAASLDPSLATDTRSGTFVGARLRMALGGSGRSEAKLGLTFAPMLRGESSDGRVRMRFGEGVGMSLTGRGAGSLNLAGRPLSSFRAGEAGLDRKNANNISTLGAVAIGVGVLVVVGGFVFYRALENASD